MNNADRHRIIRGLKDDVLALERILDLLGELITEQVSQLKPGRDSMAYRCSGSTDDRLEIDAFPGTGLKFQSPSSPAPTLNDLMNRTDEICQDCWQWKTEHLTWCPEVDPLTDEIRRDQPAVVPILKRSSDQNRIGTGSNPPSSRGSKGGRVPSHRKVVSDEK